MGNILSLYNFFFNIHPQNSLEMFEANSFGAKVGRFEYFFFFHYLNPFFFQKNCVIHVTKASY